MLVPYGLDRPGCQVRYWLAGPRHAPLVVFSHGAAFDHRMFARQVALVALNYRVLLWDVRGHGESLPLHKPFAFQDAVDDLIALLDHLGYDEAVLVGHSMGGYMSQEVAFRCPERVTALVAIDCTCLTLPHPAIIRWGMRLSPAAIRCCPYRPFTWQVARSLAVAPETRAYVAEVLSRGSRTSFTAIWDAVMNCLHDEPGYRLARPLLIICGEQDNLGLGIIRRQAPVWAARDAAPYYLVPKAGHNAHQDNPDFFNPLLHAFLAQYVQGE